MSAGVREDTRIQAGDDIDSLRCTMCPHCKAHLCWVRKFKDGLPTTIYTVRCCTIWEATTYYFIKSLGAMPKKDDNDSG